MLKTFKAALPQMPTDLTVLEAGDLAGEDSWESCHIQDADLSGITVPALSLDEALLDKVVLAGAAFDRLTARDVSAVQCDFSAARITESAFQRMLFEGGRMTGLDCSNSTFKDVTFRNCKLDMANFRHSRFLRVRFEGCLLRGADYLGATMQMVAFEQCTMDSVEFGHVTLKDVDLRSSELANIQGWRYMSGVTIDGSQLMGAAPYLAAELGIRIAN